MTIHTAIIPDELPKGSVVLDRDRIAWQHRAILFDVMGTSPHWYPANLDLAPMTWPTLLTVRGPVTELHRPEQS